jgi:hypothetical protein
MVWRRLPWAGHVFRVQNEDRWPRNAPERGSGPSEVYPAGPTALIRSHIEMFLALGASDELEMQNEPHEKYTFGANGHLSAWF